MSEPNRIRVIADEAAAVITRLRGEMEFTQSDQDRKRLRSRIKDIRRIERFMRTRVGYK